MPPTITINITDQSGRVLRSADMPAPMRETYPGGPGMFDTDAFDRLLDRISTLMREEAGR